ncbi:methylated-DNA--[protein]-cysteine S-methyltransferase [Kineococcus sp. SYSU DK001]|uniref:methylated-DNA--[protein]-cysteine S-methyltransferase n=1 Tax=Kineococcus sp. SYSU DK001 TaxID=3383122 RepID=UPI003D7CD4C1
MEPADSPLEEHLRGHLHAVLERRAAQAGVLDVAYRTVDSPLGSLLLAATEVGVVRIAFERQDHDAALDELARVVSPRVLRAPARLDGTARELEEYFEGHRTGFDVPVDLTLAGGFRLAVLDVLRRIGFGATLSYAGVAERAGSPRAVRAVGTACARNPVPLVVPCHRVVRSDGSVGEYAGGPQAKRLLLALERGAKVGG